MKTYLIDGNNLIGKIKSLFQLQKKEKQASREQLVFLLEKYFKSQKNKALLFFDGFQSAAIAANHVRIKYSDSRTADDLIRDTISHSKNSKNLTLVTSDLSLANFAKVCSAEVIKSEVFAKAIHRDDQKESEHTIVSKLQNQNDEFKKLFGV